MCGIAGIYEFGAAAGAAPDDLRKMCGAMRHRGPDDEGYYSDGRINLGMRRLAIIDLATGRQPVHNEDGSVRVVLNGEIYNFASLRRDLEKKHSFYTKSDTETIVHLYEEHGFAGCVERLRGMFAFALWDSRLRKLFIAKDRVGKKPLYYFVSDGEFAFASEIGALLCRLKKNPEISPEAVDLYLTYQYIPSPRTIYKEIKSLPPAHILVCDKNGDVSTERYWSIDFRRKTDMSFGEAVEKTRALLSEATELRMVSDVPLGAFLSGGHDSSIVVGLMSRLSSKPVRTFSIGFEEEDFSELPYARLAAERFGAEHSEFIVRPDFRELLPKITAAYGQPFADSSALPSYVVSAETRKSVTVALNGDGGDETFGGYLRYKALNASKYASPLFYLLGEKNSRRLADAVPFRNKKYFRYLSRMISGLSLSPAMKNIWWHCIFPGEMRRDLYTAEFSQKINGAADEYLLNAFESAPAAGVLDRAFYADIMTYLPECLLVKMDIASMSNSLEARSPFLDHKVLEFSASLPSSWKIRGLETKRILKKAFSDILPPEILKRPKQGFGIPLDKWFRGEWGGMFLETVMSPRALARGYFRKEALERIYSEHKSGRRNHGYRMWALLMLEMWARICVEGEKSS